MTADTPAIAKQRRGAERAATKLRAMVARAKEAERAALQRRATILARGICSAYRGLPGISDQVSMGEVAKAMSKADRLRVWPHSAQSHPAGSGSPSSTAQGSPSAHTPHNAAQGGH